MKKDLLTRRKFLKKTSICTTIAALSVGGTSFIYASTEDTFNGAKNAYTEFLAYFNTVAQEIGMERAVALCTKMYVAMGAAQGKMIKEQAGVEEIDAIAAALSLKNITKGIGINSEVIEESPQKVVTKFGRCPLYEAAQVVGMDAETIETLCRAGGVKFVETMFKQLNPNLNHQLKKYRSAADDFCEEEIMLG